MVTTLACLTEAMHFLKRDVGWDAQARLWQLILDGRLDVYGFTSEDVLRMHSLMQEYADVPMDLADASLLVLAENLELSLVFTIDSHFHAFRLSNGRSFRVTPSA